MSGTTTSHQGTVRTSKELYRDYVKVLRRAQSQALVDFRPGSARDAALTHYEPAPWERFEARLEDLRLRPHAFQRFTTLLDRSLKEPVSAIWL